MARILLSVIALMLLTIPDTQAQQSRSRYEFGGIFTRNLHQPPHPRPCRYANPYTGACSCPSGFREHQFWEWRTSCSNGFYADGMNFRVCFVAMFQCTR